MKVETETSPVRDDVPMPNFVKEAVNSVSR
jgi:hypothetical protein